MDFESKQQVLDVLAPELTPEEAASYHPMAQAQFEARTRAYEKAKADSATCKATVDANAETARFLSTKAAALTAERDELKANLRTEIYAMHSACDVEGISEMLRKKTDAVDFIDAAYSFLLEVKMPADEILWLDALENEAIAEHGVICAAAVLNRTRTIIALGPVIESEGGQVGVIGGATERLKSEAQAAYKRIDIARNTARDARLAYERLQSSRTSRGIITSANTAHVFGR